MEFIGTMPTCALGPLAEQSNRVIRRYTGFESYFIRVSFTDEADGRAQFEHEVDNQAFTHERIGRFLKNCKCLFYSVWYVFTELLL